MNAVLAKPPAFEAGSFNYSNAGYIIVGAVIEKLIGKPWETVIREKLFNPLGMKTAGFGCCSSPNATDGTWGHVTSGEKLVPRYGDNHRGLGPAGTVHCSIPDYLKFASWHSSLGTRPVGILPKQAFTRLHKSEKGEYAMGWMGTQRSWAKGVAYTHAGSNTMNFFVVWIAPQIDLALAVACNASRKGIEHDLDELAADLVKRYS
jgi:CubicO group peptidase (beta-lactamase class C family)